MKRSWGSPGIAYRDLVAEWRADRVTPRRWEVYRDQVLDPLVHLDETSDGIMSEPYDPKRGIRQLSKSWTWTRFLGSKGLEASTRASRLKLMPGDRPGPGSCGEDHPAVRRARLPARQGSRAVPTVAGKPTRQRLAKKWVNSI